MARARGSCPSRRKGLLVSAILALLLVPEVFADSVEPRADPARRSVDPHYGKLPLIFEPNVGQTDEAVAFVSRGRRYGLYVTATEAVFTLRKGAGPNEKRDGALGKPTRPTVLRMELLGADTEPVFEGRDASGGTSNYFLGNDPASWHTAVPHFKKVFLGRVYPGIDLVYYGKDGELEFDFLVSPGADPSQIQLKFEGQENLNRDASGNLIALLPGGSVTLQKPQVYQELKGIRRAVQGRFAVGDGGAVSFELGAYDKAQPLIIDPVLLYSTYLGGSGRETPTELDVDPAGNLYLTGRTDSLDFPGVGAPTVGIEEAFVVKLNPSGTAIVFAAYLGGAERDVGRGIAVDGDGNVYVTGHTRSLDFPILFAAQPVKGEDTTFVSDAFLTKLTPDGTSIVFSTYLGGSGFSSGPGANPAPAPRRRDSADYDNVRGNGAREWRLGFPLG